MQNDENTQDEERTKELIEQFFQMMQSLKPNENKSN